MIAKSCIWKYYEKKEKKTKEKILAWVHLSLVAKRAIWKKIIGHEHIQSGDDKKCKLIDSSSHQRFWQIGETMHSGQII